VTAILLLVAIVGVVAGGAWLRQRRSDREISSIDQHRSTLTTLASIERRTDVRSLRRSRPSDSAATVLPRVDPGNDHLHVEDRGFGEQVYVFDDAKPFTDAPSLDVEEQRRADWAIHHMGSNHRGRHPLGLWMAVGLLAVAVAIGALVEHQSGTTPVVTLPPSSTTTTSTTTTTLPDAVPPVSSGPGVATYAVSTPTYAITVHPASPCWVQITGTGSSTTLFAATVPVHGGATIPLTEGASVSIGSPSGVQILLNGAPIKLPTLASPTVLTFTVPVPSSTTSTVPSATTTTLPSNVLTG